MKKLNFKKQILNILTESFLNNDKEKLKKVLHFFKTKKALKDLYLLYEDIENKYLDDIKLAEEYVNILSEKLKGKDEILYSQTDLYNLLTENTKDYYTENEELYSNLDTLLESDNLKNIDKKILAKKFLINYLTTKKEIENENIDISINENLLNTILSNNFNAYYSLMLTEDEKAELKSILMLSNDEFVNQYNTIKETVINKIDTLLIESTGELKEKLETTKKEIFSMNINKYNFYKLSQLKKEI